ncbi:MAG: hypothetical protein S4CHLAM7_06980 [Chlamydiae bacterium]|nr:hypothetical protein [Chlamydiota bacterium]
MQPEKLLNKDFTADAKKETLEEALVDNDQDEKVIMRRRASDVIFLVDASASMEIKDTRIKTSRLDFAKEIIEEVVSKLDGQNVALYAFTSEVTPIVPPTLDYFFTRMLLRSIKINEGDVAGTDLLEALELMSKKYLSGPEKRQKVLIVLTDGGDTYLESLQDKERENHVAVILDKIAPHKENRIKVFTIGLGTEQGREVPGLAYEGKPVVSSLDSLLLSQLSEAGSGRYFFANDYSAPQISENIISLIKEDSAYIEEEVIPKQMLQRSVLEKKPQNEDVIHYYQIPLCLAILLLGIELLMPCIPVKKQVILDE